MSLASIASIGVRLAGFGTKFAGLSVLNPWVLLGIAAALGVVAAGSGKAGYEFAQALCRSAEADRRELAEEIRSANLDLAAGISMRTEEAIQRIRITQRTIIQPEIRHEREIHKVLQDPACSLPLSTVRVLNHARGYVETPAIAAPASPSSGASEPSKDSDHSP